MVGGSGWSNTASILACRDLSVYNNSQLSGRCFQDLLISFPRADARRAPRKLGARPRARMTRITEWWRAVVPKSGAMALSIRARS